MNTQVTVGTGSTLVSRPNPVRRRIILVNNSDEDIYLSLDGPAISSSGVPLRASGGTYIEEKRQPGDYIFRGQFTAICASGSKVLSLYEEDDR